MCPRQDDLERATCRSRSGYLPGLANIRGIRTADRATLRITQKNGEYLDNLLDMIHRIAERYDFKINAPVIRIST